MCCCTRWGIGACAQNAGLQRGPAEGPVKSQTAACPRYLGCHNKKGCSMAYKFTEQGGAEGGARVCMCRAALAVWTCYCWHQHPPYTASSIINRLLYYYIRCIELQRTIATTTFFTQTETHVPWATATLQLVWSQAMLSLCLKRAVSRNRGSIIPIVLASTRMCSHIVIP